MESEPRECHINRSCDASFQFRRVNDCGTKKIKVDTGGNSASTNCTGRSHCKERVMQNLNKPAKCISTGIQHILKRYSAGLIV